VQSSPTFVGRTSKLFIYLVSLQSLDNKICCLERPRDHAMLRVCQLARFVYDFCISKVDSESVHLAYSLLELVFVRPGSFSVSKDFADTDIQTMIDALCTA